MEWFRQLLSNDGFIPRAMCGNWTKDLIWLHNISDFFIWSAYIAIPIVLVKFAYSRRRELPFRQLFWLFGLFILACGTTHLMDIVMFYNPLYRLAGAIKLITAAASWGTVIALFYVTPMALRMRTPEDLEREIASRKLAEAELQKAHDNLEVGVQERTSELQATTAELRASEGRFRLLTEVMPQIVWTALPDGFFEYHNGRWAEYTGIPGEEALGMGWQSVLHPDDIQKSLDAWQDAIKSGTDYEIEHRLKRASDGTYRWHLGRALPLRDDEANIVKWFGTYTDIDDQKRAQQELQHSHAVLEARVLERTIELSEANTAQQHLVLALEDANNELETRVIERTAALAKTNAELQIAKDEADRANAAKSEFLSRVSHELRTPLNAILGFGQLLEMDNAHLTEEQSEGVQHILGAGKHLLGLVNEILDITRIEVSDSALSMETVQLNDVVDEALDMVQPLATSAEVFIAEDLSLTTPIFVLADRQRLLQIFLNLLSNAIKYNKSGGRVTLTTEILPEDRMRFHIIDTGHGIAAEDLPKLFVPFSRLNAEEMGVEGTGLGLVLCQRLVQAMNGTMFVESEYGQGSTFTVELPLAATPTHVLAKAEDETSGSSPHIDANLKSSKQTVLLIEDNVSNFQLIEAIFKNLTDVKLMGAMQGGLGVELAKQQRPDLILLDLHLPDMMGDEVLRRLLAIPEIQNVPVIILSADTTPMQINRLLAQGARQYLTKPLDVKQFLKAVDDTIHVH